MTLADAYRAGREVSTWVGAGMPLAGDPERRLRICRSCERYDPAGFCRACHCYMPFKATLGTSVCPLGKW